MKMKLLIAAAMMIPVVMFALALLSLDEPDYTVVEEHEAFELRRYAPLIVAETKVEASFDAATENASPLLVDYVQRGNQGERNLPMLAPVRQQLAPDAPGSATGDVGSGGDGPWLYQFAMPKEYRMSMLPQPSDDRVTLRQLPEQLVAARRYNGSWSEGRYREQEAALLDALQANGLVAVSNPVFARYNAPFVPGFLRRNEVMIEVREPGGS
jgi:hypothetical protein